MLGPSEASESQRRSCTHSQHRRFALFFARTAGNVVQVELALFRDVFAFLGQAEGYHHGVKLSVRVRTRQLNDITFKPQVADIEGVHMFHRLAHLQCPPQDVVLLKPAHALDLGSKEVAVAVVYNDAEFRPLLLSLDTLEGVEGARVANDGDTEVVVGGGEFMAHPRLCYEGL